MGGVRFPSGVEALLEIIADERPGPRGGRSRERSAGGGRDAAVVGQDRKIGRRRNVHAGSDEVRLPAAVGGGADGGKIGEILVGAVRSVASRAHAHHVLSVSGRRHGSRTALSGVARDEEGKKIGVPESEIVHVAGAQRVSRIERSRTARVVRPGIGMDPDSLRVGLLEDRVEPVRRASEARQVSALRSVGREPRVLDDEARARGHSVSGIVSEQMSEIVARGVARHVRSVPLVVIRVGIIRPIAGSRELVARVKEVVGRDLSMLRGRPDPVLPGRVGVDRESIGRVREVARIDVQPRVENPDRLGRAENPVRENRRRAERDSRLNRADRAVVRESGRRPRERREDGVPGQEPKQAAARPARGELEPRPERRIPRAEHGQAGGAGPLRELRGRRTGVSENRNSFRNRVPGVLEQLGRRFVRRLERPGPRDLGRARGLPRPRQKNSRIA